MALHRGNSQDHPIPAPASVEGLADHIVQIGAMLLHARGRAMILDHQADLRVLADPTDIGWRAAEVQSNMRSLARYHLEVLMPRASQVLGRVGSLVKLVGELEASADQVRLTRLALAMGRYVTTVQGVARAMSSAAVMARVAEQNLSGTLSATLQKIEGPDGTLSSSYARIEICEYELFNAIEEALSQAGDLAGQPGALRILEGGVIAEAGPGSELGEIEPLRAARLTVLPDAAPAPVVERSRRLRARYDELAARGALVAAAGLIGNQAGAMAAAAHSLDLAFSALARGIERQAAECRMLARQTADPQNAGRVACRIAQARREWSLLGARLRVPLELLSGTDRIFAADTAGAAA
ncbi:hypothetical protein [Paracoccus siganidrum]|uniref:hypothetical protein n=1 Tax=Paracoccus siganidrum TaxID=1276757 RepID=UPI0011C46379|nr:hypothetical protein [Paracoccus siganidrum]